MTQIPLPVPANPLAPCGEPEKVGDARRAHAENKLGKLAQQVKDKIEKGRMNETQHK